MTNITKRVAELMTWDEKDLKKHLRKVGKQANLKLRKFYEETGFDNLPIETRNQIRMWTKPNKGKFYVAPRKEKTIKELAFYIAHAERMTEFSDEGKAPIPDWLAEQSDAFQKYYDPSDFWRIYYSEWAQTGTSEEEYINIADLWANYKSVTDVDDFMQMLRDYPSMTPDDYDDMISSLGMEEDY